MTEKYAVLSATKQDIVQRIASVRKIIMKTKIASSEKKVIKKKRLTKWQFQQTYRKWKMFGLWIQESPQI